MVLGLVFLWKGDGLKVADAGSPPAVRRGESVPFSVFTGSSSMSTNRGSSLMPFVAGV